MAAVGWRKIGDAMRILASSEAEQKAYLDSMGFPVPIKDDLAEEFSFLVECMEANGKTAEFGTHQLELITRVDAFLDQKSGDDDPEFWAFGTPSCNAGWEELRVMAKAYLALGITDEPDIFAAQ